VHDDKGVRLADREIWLDRSLDGTTGLRVGGLPGTSRFLAPSAFGGTDLASPESKRALGCVSHSCGCSPLSKCARGSRLWIILLRPEMKAIMGETSPERSANMSRIRSKDTKPEMLVRKALHRLGFRFRLHVRELPGHPDIVLPKYRMVIQVKGCFWHGHTCPDGRLPKSNRDYWVPKLHANQRRDVANDRKLRRLGWSVRNLWECRVCSLSRDHLNAVLGRMLRGNKVVD